MNSLHLDIDEPHWHNNDMWRTDELDMDDVEDISHSLSSMQANDWFSNCSLGITAVGWTVDVQLEPVVYRSIEPDLDDVEDVVDQEHMDDDEPPALQGQILAL